MNATLLALLVCVVAAALEGALAGNGARQRFAELRMPAYSPPFLLWLVIGAAYYVICFIVLRHLLASGSFTPLLLIALALLIFVLLANALWSVVFFRCAIASICCMQRGGDIVYGYSIAKGPNSFLLGVISAL